MAKKEKKAVPAVEQVLAPLGSVIVLALAAVHSLQDRRNGREAESAEGPSDTAPGPQEKDPGGHRLGRIGRVPVVGKAVAVQRRYTEIHGNDIAAAVTFQAFVSLFPILLLAVSVAGFLAADRTGNVAGHLVSGLGLTGTAAATVQQAVGSAQRGRGIVGALGLIAPS